MKGGNLITRWPHLSDIFGFPGPDVSAANDVISAIIIQTWHRLFREAGTCIADLDH